MLDVLAPFLGPIAIGGVVVGGLAGAVIGRQTKRRPVVMRTFDTQWAPDQKLVGHRHEFAQHRQGEVNWRCVFPGCEAIGPRIPGAAPREDLD